MCERERSIYIQISQPIGLESRLFTRHQVRRSARARVHYTVTFQACFSKIQKKNNSPVSCESGPLSFSLSFTYYSQRLDIGAAFAFAAVAGVAAGVAAAVADDAGADDGDG